MTEDFLKQVAIGMTVIIVIAATVAGLLMWAAT